MPPSKKQRTSTDEMAAPEQFEGFVVKTPDKWNEFTKEKVWKLILNTSSF